MAKIILTEAQVIANAKNENQIYAAISKIVDNLPEEQWIAEIQKTMPDIELLAVHDMIQMHFDIKATKD